MVICALIPRFELLASCAGDRGPLRSPAALAPEPGRSQLVGQVSRAAEVYGIREGMRLGEALARCPELELIPPDPIAMSELWERALKGLEEIGAAVQPASPGVAYFEADGLLGLYRDLAGVGEAAREAIDPDRTAAGRSARLAAAPSRFASRMAAGLEEVPSGEGAVTEHGSRGARYRLVRPDRCRSFLDSLPTSSLIHAPRDRTGEGRFAAEIPDLIRNLERLGLETLGQFAALAPGRVSERFGRFGLRLHRLARGEKERLRPRLPSERLEERLELPDSLDGAGLTSALELLVDRLLALPERHGRRLRSLTLSAGLAGGGSWRTEVAFNQPTASPDLIKLILSPRLAALPGPASSLAVRIDETAPEAAAQPRLIPDAGHSRRERLGEAVRQTHATAGRDSLLRVLTLDPNSRLPERRAMLSPHQPGPDPGRE